MKVLQNISKQILFCLLLFLFPAFFLSCSEENRRNVPESDVAIISKCIKNKNFCLYTKNDAPIFLGNFQKKSEMLTIMLYNDSAYDLEIPFWRSPCPCIELAKTPERIPAHGKAELHLSIIPSSYAGKIIKNIPISCRRVKKEFTVFLPISFFANSTDFQGKSDQIPVQFMQNNKIKYISYTGDGLNAPQYRNATAWIFSGKTCSDCNYLKTEVFPKVFSEKTKIIQVDLDNKEKLLLLLELEKKLNVKNPGDAPVLYYRGNLFYGVKKIQKELQNISD